MATPAENLEGAVSLLEEANRNLSKILTGIHGIISAIKNIKVVQPKEEKAKAAQAAKEKTPSENIQSSFKDVAKSADPVSTAIVSVSQRIDEMGGSIQRTTSSIIEFGSMFSQWEDDFREIPIEIMDSLPDLSGEGRQIQRFGKIVEYSGRSVDEYGRLYSQWEDAQFLDGVELLANKMDDLGSSFETAAIGGGGGGGLIGGGRGVGGEGEMDDSILSALSMALPNMFSKAVEGIAAAAMAAAKGLMLVTQAVANAPGYLFELINLISGFVKALDPALMAQLQLVISDLMATIGVGLRPIIQAIVPIIRAFADTLMPLANMLAPVMQQFGNALIKVAAPIIALWANVINMLIPVLESIIPLFYDIAEILSVLTPVLLISFDGIARGLNLAIGVVHTFMVGIKAITVALLDAAAWVTSWFSSSGEQELKDMSKSVQESMDRSMEAQADSFSRAFGPSRGMPEYTQGASVGAAAKQASYSGIADLGKNMMQAAFGQSQQNAALQTADNTKVMAEGMKQLVGWALGQGKQNAPQQGVR